MDFKNVDLSNFKIPDIAQGKIIPYGVYKHLEQDGKEKKQRSHNWKIAIFGAIISLHVGFHQVDPEKITLIYTLGGSTKDAFTKVVLPGSMPIILSTAKVNIGLALVGVIIGEFLAARRGLGYLIIYGSQVFQLDMVITSIILLCFIALGFYKSVQTLEHQIKKKFKI